MALQVPYAICVIEAIISDILAICWMTFSGLCLAWLYRRDRRNLSLLKILVILLSLSSGFFVVIKNTLSPWRDDSDLVYYISDVSSEITSAHGVVVLAVLTNAVVSATRFDSVSNARAPIVNVILVTISVFAFLGAIMCFTLALSFKEAKYESLLWLSMFVTWYAVTGVAWYSYLSFRQVTQDLEFPNVTPVIQRLRPVFR